MSPSLGYEHDDDLFCPEDVVAAIGIGARVVLGVGLREAVTLFAAHQTEASASVIGGGVHDFGYRSAGREFLVFPPRAGLTLFHKAVTSVKDEIWMRPV